MVSQIYRISITEGFHQMSLILCTTGCYVIPWMTTVGTYQLNQTLTEQSDEQLRVCNHHGLNTLHLKAFEDVNRVVRMDGGQHQMPGHGGFYCRNGGIVIADFTVQDAVRIKTQC